MAAMAEVVDRETGEIQVDEREGWADARVHPRFIQQRQGKPFATYPGLLDLLHRQSKHCFSIDTLVVQLPTEENGRVAVCTARVRVFDPQNLDVVTLETSGVGDADPSNCTPAMRGHLLRLAETRAKARALRDAVNVGEAVLEELGPDEQAPATPVASPSVEGIIVEGRRFTRPEVVLTKQARVEACQEAGIPLPVPIPADDAPLREQVGFSQRLRELLLQQRRTGEARAQGK